jgi:uncharacterized protein
MVRGFPSTLSRILVGHPRTVLALFLVFTAGLGWQARHFQIDASADTLLMRNNPDYIQTELVDRRFSPREFLLIVYRPKGRPLFSRQTFRDIKRLTRQLHRIKRVQSVRSILDVPLFSRMTGGISSLKDLSRWTIERGHFSAAQLREAFRGSHLYEDLLINRAQNAVSLQVLFKRDRQLDDIDGRILHLQEKSLRGPLSAGDEKILSRLRRREKPLEQRLEEIRTEEIKTIRRWAAGYEKQAEIYLGGVHVLGYQLIRIIRNDLVVFGGAIGAMICLLLFVLFRKMRWVLVSVVCCGSSVLATVGLFGLMGFKTTVISSNFIVLELILTLAIVIHLIVQYREYAADHPDWSQGELVRQTLSRKAGPCFYAGLTTVVGFGSLLFSGIQPVIAFGWMMMIAICLSTGFSLGLFPAMMALTGREESPGKRGLSDRMLRLCTRLALDHAGLVTLAGAGVLAFSISGLFFLNVENSFINYFKKTTRVHRELVFIDRQFGGSTPLDLVYTIPPTEKKQDLVLTATTVQRMQRIQLALKRHRAVGKILSVVNFTEVAKRLNGGRPLTEYELTAAYWTMSRALRDKLLGSFFDPDTGQVRFSLRIKDTTPGLNRARLLTDIRKDMYRLGIPKNRYVLSNLFILYQDILQRLFRSQILTIGIVYAVLTLTFFFIFRSIKIALIGIAPNLLSVLVVLAVMGWAGISLDLMTITIASIAMGIAVDDTIHYIHRYLEELAHTPAKEAVAATHASVGHAIVTTSLVIILGFSLLAFSDFVPSILFGLLTGLAMLVALVFVLCLLPVMLARFVRTPSSRPPAADGGGRRSVAGAVLALGVVLMTAGCAAVGGRGGPGADPPAEMRHSRLPGPAATVAPTVVGITHYRDPLIRLNRAVFAFNDITYRYLLIPLAKGYTRAVPDPVRKGVGNFFDNLKMPIDAVNHLLQLKPRLLGRDLLRFAVNSTVGVGGLFDPAKAWWHMEKADTDFRYTLARYGAGYGLYLVLPLLGPSDLRGGASLLFDYFLNPVFYLTADPERSALNGFDEFQDFAPGAKQYEILRKKTKDPYIFFRNLYLQGTERDVVYKDKKK